MSDCNWPPVILAPNSLILGGGRGPKALAKDLERILMLMSLKLAVTATFDQSSPRGPSRLLVIGDVPSLVIVSLPTEQV